MITIYLIEMTWNVNGETCSYGTDVYASDHVQAIIKFEREIIDKFGFVGNPDEIVITKQWQGDEKSLNRKEV